MYEAPIKLFWTDPTIQQVKDEFDDAIFQSVAKVGVVVDKEELIKALAYDRAEYERGLRDGMQIAENEINQLHVVIEEMNIKIKRLIQRG